MQPISSRLCKILAVATNNQVILRQLLHITTITRCSSRHLSRKSAEINKIDELSAARKNDDEILRQIPLQEKMDTHTETIFTININNKSELA